MFYLGSRMCLHFRSLLQTFIIITSFFFFISKDSEYGVRP